MNVTTLWGREKSPSGRCVHKYLFAPSNKIKYLHTLLEFKEKYRLFMRHIFTNSTIIYGASRVLAWSNQCLVPSVKWLLVCNMFPFVVLEIQKFRNVLFISHTIYTSYLTYNF